LIIYNSKSTIEAILIHSTHSFQYLDKYSLSFLTSHVVPSVSFKHIGHITKFLYM